MSKILLIGYNPPFLAGKIKIEAAHYRTWQFLDPLLADGHTVCLCADTPDPAADIEAQIPSQWRERLTCRATPFARQNGWGQKLQAVHDLFKPDCIIAVNFDCCLYATKLKTTQPIWMDIYGDYLTILQVARFRIGNDRGIPTSIAFMREVLQRGDAFSGCGTPQQHALVGELAMAGRLNSRTFGFPLAYRILPGSPPQNSPAPAGKAANGPNKVQLPETAFVVLWCGGYNTWTDVETLFNGLEWAMARHEHIHYISVGANTYEAPDNVYTRLLELINRSDHRARYHMLGWVPWAEVAGYYRQSNVGINIDALHYETIYGTRTRLVEMLAAGLPVITSLGCELSDLLGQYGAGLTFASGDAVGLGKHILALAEDKNSYQTMVERALHYAHHELSFYTTTAPVRTWAAQPVLSPDHDPARFPPQNQLEYQLRAVLRQALWRITGRDK